MSHLSQLLESLEVSPHTDNVLSFANKAQTVVTSEQKLTDVFDMIYKKSLLNWRFSATAGQLCQQLSMLQTDGVKFRDIMLKSIQKDFKSKICFCFNIINDICNSRQLQCNFIRF